jgi:hypothetical protein
MKFPRAWRRTWRRWVVAAGVIVFLVVLTVWYREYSAEKLAEDAIAARNVPWQDKADTRLKPASNVADRPTRDRGPRP